MERKEGQETQVLLDHQAFQDLEAKLASMEAQDLLEPRGLLGNLD
jgi:hypothetical protein